MKTLWKWWLNKSITKANIVKHISIIPVLSAQVVLQC